jgi:hypothetical protein
MHLDIDGQGEISLMGSAVLMLLISRVQASNLVNVAELKDVLCRRTLQKYILELRSKQFVVMVNKNTVMLSPYRCWREDRTKAISTWRKLCTN